MRVSVPIDSSDAKATSSGDTTRRDGFGTPHAGANTNVSNGPTDARSTNRRIMALALPTFGQLTAEPTFILIDTAIVGHIGDAALAGLSIGSTIILTAVGLCIFLAYSTTAQVAHLLGAGRRREGLQAGIDGLWLALSIGTVLGLGLFAAAEPLCRALGGQGEVLEQAVTYTRAIVLGAPGMLMVYAANGIFRGLQKVRITLIAAVGGAVVNTVLDVLFVIVLNWGIAGSGVATLVAQWFMGLFLVIPAILWSRADGASLRPRLAGIAAAGGDGLPLFIRTLAIRAAMVTTVACAARMGTAVLAGFQAVNSSWNFAMNMLDSVGIAGQTLVATALGAGSVQQARRLTRATGRAGLVTGAVIGHGFCGSRPVRRALLLPYATYSDADRRGHGDDGHLLPTARLDDGNRRHSYRRARLPLSGRHMHADRRGVCDAHTPTGQYGDAGADERPDAYRRTLGRVQRGAHGWARSVQRTTRALGRMDEVGIGRAKRWAIPFT